MAFAATVSAQNEPGALFLPQDDGEVSFPAVWNQQSDPTPTTTVFIYPLASTVMAVAGVLYVPVGGSVALDDRLEWSFEASLLYGDMYGCSSVSLGGWVASGLSIYMNDERDGLFILPKLVGRYFSTSAAQSGSWLSCSESEASELNEVDYELHAGVDIGYRFTLGDFVITPLLGASAGYCGNCIEGGPFFSGDPTTLFEHGPRANKASLGLNLNLLRLGFRF